MTALTKLSALALMEVVEMTPSGTTSDENLIYNFIYFFYF